MVEPSTAFSSSTSLPLEPVSRDATSLLSSRITALSSSLRFPTLFQVPRSGSSGESFPVVLDMSSGFEGIRVPGSEPFIFLLAIPTQHQTDSMSGFSETSATSPTGKVSPASADDDHEERSELQSAKTSVSPVPSSVSPTAPSALEIFRRKNPDFGSAKSPKSYWLRRHSDSVLDASLTVTATSGGKTDDRSSSMTTSPNYDNPLNHNRTVSESCCTDSWDTKQVCLQSNSACQQKLKSSLHEHYQSSAVDLSTTSDFNDEVFEEEDDASSSTLSRSGSIGARVPGGELVDIAEEGSSEETGSWKDGRAEMSDEEMYVRDATSRRMLSGSDIKLEEMEAEISSGGEFHSSSLSPPRNNWPFKMTPVGIPSPGDVCPRRVQRRSKKVASDTAPADSDSPSTKNHRCPVCRRAFSRSDMLERHARLHTGLRPYACRLCTQVFSRSDHLTTHLRTHTGEKPYSCPRCSYSASRRDMVTRHLRVHSGSAGSDNIPVGCALGPSRRRVYRTRYRSRPSTTADPVPSTTVALSPPGLPLQTIDQSPNGFSWSVPKSDHKPIVSGPSSEPLVNRRWSKARLLAGLDIDGLSLSHQHQRDMVLARGSTGSTDSYCSPSIVGGSASSEVFEFDGILSPDVFRSPGSARLASRFLWPFPPPTSTSDSHSS